MGNNKLKRVFSAAGTLREMQVGTSIVIPTTKIKSSTLRKAASDLKKKGYRFNVSVAGLINETRVIRTK